MQTQNKIYKLSSRRILQISGEDAGSFLQNVITNDIEKLQSQGIIYTCLLSPQGQILNEFFITPAPGQDGYWIDIDQEQLTSFQRRLTFFKLRAKVSMSVNENIHVYAGNISTGMTDPRFEKLGNRFYTQEVVASDGHDQDYEDFCIQLGVPVGFATIHAERDVAADANLDILNAVAFDKGCFIGQEVAARMYHRNLSRKRIMVVTGDNLQKGQALYQKAVAVGDIRTVAHDGKSGLALVKLTSLSAGPVAGQELSTEADGNIAVRLQNPAYIQF